MMEAGSGVTKISLEVQLHFLDNSVSCRLALILNEDGTILHQHRTSLGFGEHPQGGEDAYKPTSTPAIRSPAMDLQATVDRAQS
jgi:hypothetical protein